MMRSLLIVFKKYWLKFKNNLSPTIKNLAGQFSFYIFGYKIVSSSNFSSRFMILLYKDLPPLQHPFAIWTVPAQLMIA